jgi:uncharacterized protein
LRGLAVLGIILANVSSFSRPMMDIMDPGLFASLNQTDRVWDTLRDILVSGKFRGLLSIIFGVGIYLQYLRRKDLEKGWPNTFFNRMMILFFIGLFHFIFIWYGDILAYYAAVACLAAILIKYSDKVLVWVAGIAGSLGLLGGALLSLLLTLVEAFGPSDVFSGSKAGMFSPVVESRIYTEGSYLDQVGYRFVMAFSMFGNFLLLAPITVGLMCVGILLARRGFFRPETRQPSDMKALITLFAVGLFLNVVPALLRVSWPTLDISMFIEMGASAILAPGLLGAAVWLWEKLPAWTIAGFERVGKVSLSVYLLQSIIATSVFYSWGGGLFGRLDLGQQLGVALLIAVGVSIAAVVWTAFFSIGPVEWLWRSIELRRKLPWKKEPNLSPEASAP